jgi:hypothetical protein
MKVREIYRRHKFYLFLGSLIFPGEGGAESVRADISEKMARLHAQRQTRQMENAVGAGARLAQILGENTHSRAMNAMARGIASGIGSNAIEQSLAPFGTARVKLNFAQGDGLSGSEFDFLYPLSESGRSLSFFQSGLRRLDDRTMINIGLGQRFWLSPSSMAGYNVFFDHDVTRRHNRLGTGLEYARDYFRLAANGYFRLSGWKSSRDFTDYQERVANGFDIRSEAWLPSLPWLGGRLAYTRFYGDSVGIYGPGELQKNPELFSIGVNYTPVPMLGVSAVKTFNTRGGGNELSMAVNLSWQLGVPLKDQLDAGRVGQRRTLKGARYDLVDRNNVIVLEYQKDRLFNIGQHKAVSATENTVVPLALNITAKYPVSGINWNAATWFNAGGDAFYQDGGWRLQMPEWKPQADNRYRLEGRAIDERGNISPPFSVEVEVLPLAVKISLAGDLKGEEGQTLAIGLNARMKNPVKEVRWNAAEFLAAGGKFIQKEKDDDSLSLHYYAVLPAWRNQESNQYPVQVSVTDNEGNVSNSAQASITVEPRSIILSLPESLSAAEGDEVAIPLSVRSKTPVVRYEWQAEAFIANKGKIFQKDDRLWAVMPAWSTQAENDYPLVITAFDGEGRASAPVSTILSVASTAISLALDGDRSGVSGGKLLLTPRVTSQAALARIEWQGAAFFRQGGSVVKTETGDYQLILPVWKRGQNNRYVLNATAWDVNGRVSTSILVEIEVRPAVITLSAPDALEGTERDKMGLHIDVVSENTVLDNVEFSAQAFLDAGGKITGQAPDYQLILPEWNANATNVYAVQAVARDVNGNQSDTAVIQVKVNESPVTLDADDRVTGFEGESLEVETRAESLYGIASYQFEAAKFSQAGGRISAQDHRLKLTLPDFEVGGENRYTVVVRALDNKGRRSAPLSLNVVVTTRLLNADGQCSVVGGGAGYRGLIDKSAVNYQQATDYATLKALVDRGEKYIYIPGDADIVIPALKNALVVRSGTTIFSDRGRNGSAGARLSVSYIDENEYKFPIIVMTSDTRLSGIRYEGPYQGTTTANTTIGIQTADNSRNIEIDNMELWGWPWAAVSVRNALNVRVHHSYIHDNIRSQLGYGVVTQNGNAKAEVACNLFNSNRHAIAGSGRAGEGYMAHHNLVLNGGGRGAYHQYDMHLFPSQGIAGEFMDISWNWFDYGRYGTSNRSSIGVRGQPTRGPITVTNNWFSQGWVVGSQRAVAGEYGAWVPTEEKILADNQFNVKFNYLEKGNNQCVIDWLSSSQSVNCYGLGYKK